jgi:two-component system chemotaxis response regulator CheB
VVKRDIVVICSSAGGVEALTSLVAALPAGLPASLFIVQHIPAAHQSFLPQLLTKAGRLPATHPRDGETIVSGHVYVAPPDHHLLIEDGTIRVRRGPRENGHRPAGDALFRTAARAKGPRVIGIVLTGALDDGAAGLFAVKQRGGFAVVQDPDDAYCPDMPRAALDHTDVDAVASLGEIARQLPAWTSQSVEEAPDVNSLIAAEADIALQGSTEYVATPGTPSTFSCPDCGGVLNEIEDDRRLRFRCQVGHAFNRASLHAAQSEVLEAALWAALRALEQQADLGRRLTAKARRINQPKSASWHEERAETSEQQANLIRELLGAAPRKARPR